MKKSVSEKKGMALMTVLLLTVLMVMTTVSMVFISTNHMYFVANLQNQGNAMKAAEAGIEYAISKLNDDPSWGLSSFNLRPDPSDNTMTPDPDAGVVETYAENCKFTITFDPDAPYYSVNNLFESDPGEAALSGTPCYTAKIISVGEAGSPGDTTKKILEVHLVRSDYSGYNVGTEGSLFFNYGNIFNIHGRDVDKTGSLVSNWTDPDGNDSIVFKESTFDPALCPEGEEYVIFSNKGVFSSTGTIDVMDPDKFDGYLVENLAQKAPLGIMQVDKIVDRLVEEGSTAGTLQTAESGVVTVTEIPVDLDSITEPGDYYSTITMNSTASGFDSAVTVNNAGKRTTLNLNQDIYINGSLPLATDTGRDYSELIGNSNVLQVDVADEAMAMEHYVAEYDLSGNLVITQEEPVTRDISLDLNGNNIVSDSHLVMGIDVEGEGKLISRGKIAYSQGLNKQEDQFLAICGDDLTVEVSNDTTGSYGNNYFYATDDIEIKPMENDSPLRMGDGGAEDPRDLQKNGPGKIISDEVHSNVEVNSEEGIVSYRQKVEGEDDLIIVEGRTQEDGTRTELDLALSSEAGSGVVLPEGYDESEEGCVCCHLDDDGDGFSDEENRRKEVEVNFGNYKFGMKESPDGYYYGATILDQNNNPVTLEASGLDLQPVELEALGNIMGACFGDNIPYKDINMDATIVSLNKNEQENNSNIICAGNDVKAGSVNIGRYVDYMDRILYIEGANFTVRKSSYRELK